MWRDYCPPPPPLPAALISFQIGVLCLPETMTAYPCSKCNNLVSLFFSHMDKAPTSIQIHFSVGIFFFLLSFC